MKDHPPTVRLFAAPYKTGGQHLRDELARIDLLVRAQVARWQMMIGTYKPENLWGMVHVTEAEITHYLGADVAPPDYVPEPVLEALRHFWTAEDDAAESIQKAVEQTPPNVDLRVNHLRKVLGLGHIERDIALLCLLPEIDVRYRRIYGYLQDDASRAHPTIELISQMVLHKIGSIEGVRAITAPSQPLFRNHVLVAGAPDDGRSGRFIRLDDRIVSFLLGSDEPDTRLRGILSAPPANVRWEALFLSSELIQQLRDFAELSKGRSATVILHGPYGSGKEKVARAICRDQGTRLVRFDVEEALRDPPKWELLLDLAYREARLLDSEVYVNGIERLREDDRPAHLWDALIRAAQTFQGITYLAGATPVEQSRRVRDSQFLHFEFPPPHFELRRKIWLSALPSETVSGDRNGTASTLAAAFQITEGQVHDAIAAARASARLRSFLNPQITSDDLYEACRKQAGHRLIGFARRIEPTRGLTLEDVILAEPVKEQLRELLIASGCAAASRAK